MRIINPEPIDTENLIQSNIPLDEPEWVAGTYQLEDVRRVGTYLYEVVIEGGTTDDPLDGVNKEPPSWMQIGRVNRFRMFDNIIGSKSTNNYKVEVEIESRGIPNSLALFGLAGTTLDVEVRDVDDVVGYTKHLSLAQNNTITDWYAYFFESITYMTEIALLGLPSYLHGKVKVTVNNGGIAEIGELAIGQIKVVGDTTFGVKVAIEDFSRKERDVFGNAVVVQRPYAAFATYPVAVRTNFVAGVRDFLGKIRATPCVFIGDPKRSETIVYGYYRDFSIILEGPQISHMTIEVEGLT